MKKGLIILSVMILTGCSLFSSPEKTINNFLESYNNLDESVLSKIDNYDLEELNEQYQTIIKNQYKNLKYEIKDIYTTDRKSEILVAVEVYDLYNSEKEAFEYLQTNPSELFNEDNTLNEEKYEEYKLDLMEKESKRVTYEIKIDLEYKYLKWRIVPLTTEQKEKFQGIYEYN